MPLEKQILKQYAYWDTRGGRAFLEGRFREANECFERAIDALVKETERAGKKSHARIFQEVKRAVERTSYNKRIK